VAWHKLFSILFLSSKTLNMKKQVLFVQGGGNDGFTEDAKMVDSLREALGEGYSVHYPRLTTDENAPDFGWIKQIGETLKGLDGEIYLVGHSLGASVLLKYLTETKVEMQIMALFLLATPYWQGQEDWKKGLMLKDDFAARLPKEVPVFLYHSQDDEDVPVDNLELYVQKIPAAIVRRMTTGGHQFNDDLRFVAEDISKLLVPES